MAAESYNHRTCSPCKLGHCEHKRQHKGDHLWFYDASALTCKIKLTSLSHVDVSFSRKLRNLIKGSNGCCMDNETTEPRSVNARRMRVVIMLKNAHSDTAIEIEFARKTLL